MTGDALPTGIKVARIVFLTCSRTVAKAKAIYEVPVSYYGRTYDEGKKIKAHHAVIVIWTIIMRRVLR